MTGISISQLANGLGEALLKTVERIRNAEVKHKISMISILPVGLHEIMASTVPAHTDRYLLLEASLSGFSLKTNKVQRFVIRLWETIIKVIFKRRIIAIGEKAEGNKHSVFLGYPSFMQRMFGKVTYHSIYIQAKCTSKNDEGIDLRSSAYIDGIHVL